MKQFFTFALLLTAISMFAQPANDDCPGIVNLGPAPICPPDVIYNNLNATASNIGFDNFPPCWVGNPERDVWFSFVAVDTILDYRITVTACPDPALGIDPMENPQIAVYRGDCEFDGLQLLECGSAPNNEGILEVDLFGLTPGITYFIRINDWSLGAPNDGAFKLCITKKPPINTIDQGGSTACSGNLSDSGGPEEDYGSNENFVYTICPTQPHNCINFSLEYYNVENFGDQIIFFDGPNTMSPQLGSITGGGGGANFGGVCYSVAAQSGCLTIQFISNNATVFEGFEGFWECTADECQQINPITTETGSSPADIVESVVSGLTNITITSIECENGALATFEAGPNSDLGMEKGLLMTSGSAAQAANEAGFFASLQYNGPGDADLDYLSQISGSGSVSTDACIVEMDVFASTDEITFEYIFGSEEYPGFVGSPFNDIFAFLVSGPGITGDPNIANQENIAALPDGTFIQINSVNFIDNWQYFRDNQDGQSVAYGGLTSDSLGVKKSLTARIATIPCNTYHLKFAIADRQDWSYDSGVFISDIKGGSPNLGVNYNSGIDYLVEECVNIPDEIFIGLNAPIQDTATFNLVLSGTATQGVDYTLTLPGSVTFNTGNEVFSFPIQAITDGLLEGTETIIIELVRDFGCGVTVLATLEIQLKDNLEVQIFEDQLDTVLVCAGDNGTQLNVNGAAEYFWQPPGIFSDPTVTNPIVNPDSSMWIMVTGSLGLCTDVDSVYLNLIDPQVNIIPEGDLFTICATDSIVLTAVNNVGNSNLLWTTFATVLPDPTNPVQVIYPPPFFPFVPLTVQVELGGCIATDNVQVNIDAFDFPVVANDTLICENYSVDLGTDIETGTTTYTWTPNVGLDPDNTVSGPIATPEVTTTYTLIAESSTGVCKDTAQVTITVIPIDVEIQNPDTVFICVGESATLTNTNTTAGVGLTWSPNFFLTQNSPQEVVVNPPVSTWYYASLTGGACTVVDSVLVYVDSLPDLSITATPAKETYCLGEEVLLTSPTYEPGNFPGIDLLWDDEIPGAQTPDSFLNLVFIATETHIYIRTTTVHACTSVDSIEIIVIPSILISVEPALDTICPGEAVNLTVIGPAELEEFSWSPSDDLSCSDCREPVATPGATVTYMVEAEFEGCPVGASTTLIVPAGAVFELQDDFICPGESIVLNEIDNPLAEYLWTASIGTLPDPTNPIQTVSPTVTTTYMVTATLSECPPTSGEVTITVATDFTVTVAAPPTICPNADVTLTAVVNPADAEYTFVWTDANGQPVGNGPSITENPAATTTYQVEVSDANSCFVHTVLVPVTVSPAFTVDAGADISTVAGEEIILAGTASLPGITLVWTDQAGNIIGAGGGATLAVCESGLFTLTGTDANGCTASDAVFVTVNESFFIISIVAKEVTTNDSLIYEGEEFVLIATTSPSPLPGATYEWFVGDSLVSTTNDTISEVLNAIEIFGEDIADTDTLDISVKVTIPAGCDATEDSILIIHNIPLDMPNAFSPNNDSKNDTFNIVSLIPLTINEFQVWNRWGQLVYDNENGAAGWIGKHKDKEAPSDVYIYRIVYEITGGSGKKYTKKGDVTLLR